MKISDLIQVGNRESTYLGLKMLKDSLDFDEFLNFAQINLQPDEYKILITLFNNLRPDEVQDYTISCRVWVLTKFKWYSVGIKTLYNMIKFYERIKNIRI